jgi:hypothetical protein
MCGSTGAQQQLQAQQLDAYKQSQDMLREEFGHQQAIYGPMAAKFQSIFDAGPSQKGFSAGESQDLETQVIEGTAGNYANAAKAVNEHIAAEGGTGGMANGAADELRLSTANSAAQEKTREETQLTEANYATGRQQWQNAASGLLDIASGENPVNYENASTAAGGAASTTAEDIAKEQNSWINAAMGIAGDLISANPHNIMG